jgi:hypothetical protein
MCLEEYKKTTKTSPKYKSTTILAQRELQCTIKDTKHKPIDATARKMVIKFVLSYQVAG